MLKAEDAMAKVVMIQTYDHELEDFMYKDKPTRTHSLKQTRTHSLKQTHTHTLHQYITHMHAAVYRR